MGKRGGPHLFFKIVFATIGSISGISIFISFIYFRNVNAAIWGLSSALFAMMSLRMHIIYRKNVLHIKFTPERLQIFKYIGIFGSFCSLLAAIVYFTLVGVLKQGYKLEDDGYMPSGIFSLLAFKWTALFWYYSHKYKRILSSDKETCPIADVATETQSNKV